jgi:hypothetical protein
MTAAHALARAAAAILAVLAAPPGALAQGCAMCKTALEGDPAAGAINASILFLMSMPYAIVGTVGAWIYLATRRPRAGAPESASAWRPDGE